MLFVILHGPVTVTGGSMGHVLFPYWLRQLAFYAIVLVYLPLVCGLMPFVGPGEWLEHFSGPVKEDSGCRTGSIVYSFTRDEANELGHAFLDCFFCFFGYFGIGCMQILYLIKAIRSDRGDNKVWSLVDLPPNGRTVGSKWIFKKKTDMDGNSAKQSTIAMSSTKAEYIAATEVLMESVWIRKLIDGIGDVMQSNKRPMEMLCDNAPAITIANDLGIVREPYIIKKNITTFVK
nr:protein CPR-5 [Tanacetum cinerariifolium]